MKKKIFENMRIVACALIAAAGIVGLAVDDILVDSCVAGFMAVMFAYLWVTRRKYFLVHYVGGGNEGAAYVSALGEMNIREAQNDLSAQFGCDIVVVSFMRISRRQYKGNTDAGKQGSQE